MNRIAAFWLWLFIFAIPWEDVIIFPFIGTASRLFGAVAFLAGVFAVVKRDRLRPINGFHALAGLFVLWSMATTLWSVDPGLTLARALTYLQLLALVWLVWEFARDGETRVSLMQAYVFGAYVSVISLFVNFFYARSVLDARYVTSGFDPNDLGLILALGIPLAWYTGLREAGLKRFLLRLYVPLAVVAILLTASRGSTLAGAFSLLFILWSLVSLSTQSKVLLSIGTVALVYWALSIVPEPTWQRLSTIGSELAGGTLNERLTIWRAGLEVFIRRPAFGVGAGAYGAVMESSLGHNLVAHNSFLSVLTEQGLVGFIIFLSLLVFVALLVLRLRGLERKLWVILLLTWTVGVSALSWEHRKPTWFLLALVVAHACEAPREREDAAAPTRFNKPESS